MIDIFRLIESIEETPEFFNHPFVKELARIFPDMTLSIDLLREVNRARKDAAFRNRRTMRCFVMMVRDLPSTEKLACSVGCSYGFWRSSGFHLLTSAYIAQRRGISVSRQQNAKRATGSPKFPSYMRLKIWREYTKLWNRYSEKYKAYRKQFWEGRPRQSTVVELARCQSELAKLRVQDVQIDGDTVRFGDLVADTVLRILQSNPRCLQDEWVREEFIYILESRDHRRIEKLSKALSRKSTVKLPPKELLLMEHDWLVHIISAARNLIVKYERETSDLNAHWDNTSLAMEASEELSTKYGVPAEMVRRCLEGRAIQGRVPKLDHQKIVERINALLKEGKIKKEAYYRVASEEGCSYDWVRRLYKRSQKK